jgi:hypothetical protein
MKMRINHPSFDDRWETIRVEQLHYCHRVFLWLQNFSPLNRLDTSVQPTDVPRSPTTPWWLWRVSLSTSGNLSSSNQFMLIWRKHGHVYPSAPSLLPKTVPKERGMLCVFVMLGHRVWFLSFDGFYEGEMRTYLGCEIERVQNRILP